MPWVRYAGYVGIAGLGEPFLERCLPAVLRKIIAAGAAPSVITNGTLIDDRLIEELVDIGPMLLDVSIDGATKETFEAIRKGVNFEAIVNNILRLQEAKAKAGSQYPVVQINWVWLKSNLHEVNELAALAEKMGAVAIRTQPVFLKGLSNMEHEAVTDAEVEQANREVRAHLNPSIDLVNAPLNTLQSGCSGNGAQDSKMFFCPNIWNTMQISPQGNVRVCCMGNFPDLGNIMEQSLEAIWNSPAMMSIRRAQMQGNPPDECRRCYLLQSHSGKAASRVLKQYRDILPLRNLLR
jgi:radical SAM protein with 4Fe4S-binding SPASM domain